MLKIGRFPAFGKRFFRQARKTLGRCSFQHFWRMVLAIASLHGRRSLQRIRDVLDQSCTRQALAYFLNHALWNAPQLLRQTAWSTLEQLGYRPGERIYVLIDDTQQKKRGQKMAAVQRLFLHAEKTFATAHDIICCALVYRGVVIPYAVALWAPEDFCNGTQSEEDVRDRVAFRKLTHLAASLIDQVVLPEGATAVVLFDSYYLCPAVTGACQAAGWPYISVAKKNRKFAPRGRPHDLRRLDSYGPKVLLREGREYQIEDKKHRLAERVGDLSRAGRVKLVFSRRRGEGGLVTLVTNDCSLSGSEVVREYRRRWPIEVFFKMTKQNLGLGDYQVLRYRGVVRYLHLVLIAYLLLTHLALAEAGAQAKSNSQELRLPGVAQQQQYLRDRLWKEAIQNMEQGKRYQRVALKIKKLILL